MTLQVQIFGSFVTQSSSYQESDSDINVSMDMNEQGAALL